MKKLALASLICLLSLTAQAETLKDFTGNYVLIREDEAMIADGVEAEPCLKFLNVTEGTSQDELYLDQYNDRQQILQLRIKLGHEDLSDKTFAETSLGGNTLTRHLFKKTFFSPKGREISGTYLALLEEDYLGAPQGTRLYFERSKKFQISSSCYYGLKAD